MKKALILGLGISGKAALSFILSQGYCAVIYDDGRKDLKELENQRVSAAQTIEEIDFNQLELLIPSPGIDPKHPLYQKAIQCGIPIVGEVELAFSHMKNPCIAITGTNGKTTVVKLLEHLFQASGRKARALGNVGEPLCNYLLSDYDPDEIVVAELSSYQLETMKSRVFQIGCILNITPDHLDRYKTMENYALAKAHLQNLIQDGGKFFVQREATIQFPKLFSKSAHIFDSETLNSIAPEQIKLKNRAHDLENLAAAYFAAKEFCLSDEQIFSAASSFSKPTHRIEFVEEIDGVRFINDSKGTNIDAVIKAVAAVDGQVILIAGGVDKGLSFSAWKIFKNRVKALLALGQTKEKIKNELGEDFSIYQIENLQEAIFQAYAFASPGDVVLLSPGCSSFDMFKSYAHRGDEFKRIVRELKK